MKMLIIEAGPSLTDGVTIGNGIAEKAGFHGAAVVQRASAAQAVIGNPTFAAPDAVPAAIAGGESPTEAEHNALRAAVDSLRTQVVALAADVATHRVLANELRAALVAKGAIKGAA